MPRPPNPSRSAARDAGDKTYADESNPCMYCGGDVRYTSNAQCVACAIAKGKDRYAGLDETARIELREKDHARYERRVRRGREPTRRNRRRVIMVRDPLDP